MPLKKTCLISVILIISTFALSCSNLANAINQNYIDARQYYNENDLTNALSSINDAIQKDNKQDSFYLLKANILYDDGASINAVIDECDRALELNPDNVEAKILKVECLIEDEDEGYKPIMEEISLQTYDDINILMRIARIYYTIEDYNEALIYYNDALKIEKNNPDIKYNMARCYIYLQDYDNSIKLCEEILKDYPEDVDTLNAKIYILNEQEKYEEAIDICNEVLKIDEENGITYYELYYSYYCLGDFESSLEYINKYIELAPDNASSYLYRAKIHKMLNNNEGMEEDMKAYIEKGGDEAEGNEFLNY